MKCSPLWTLKRLEQFHNTFSQKQQTYFDRADEETCRSSSFVTRNLSEEINGKETQTLCSCVRASCTDSTERSLNIQYICQRNIQGGEECSICGCGALIYFFILDKCLIFFSLIVSPLPDVRCNDTVGNKHNLSKCFNKKNKK